MPRHSSIHSCNIPFHINLSLYTLSLFHSLNCILSRLHLDLFKSILCLLSDGTHINIVFISSVLLLIWSWSLSCRKSLVLVVCCLSSSLFVDSINCMQFLVELYLELVEFRFFNLKFFNFRFVTLDYIFVKYLEFLSLFF